MARRVAVVGDGVDRNATSELAYRVGRLLGERGATVVCGGLRGVMEAAARGAREAGGHTIGLLPGLSAADANEWIETPIVTGFGEARNLMVVRNAQAVIAVGGGFGTLSEIAFALQMGLPVIGLNTWTLQRPGDTADPIVRADSPEEAVERALGLDSRPGVPGRSAASDKRLEARDPNRDSA